jgi:hypothetical protein
MIIVPYLGRLYYFVDFFYPLEGLLLISSSKIRYDITLSKVRKLSPKRIRIGKITTHGLGVGSFRLLTHSEVAYLKKSTMNS